MGRSEKKKTTSSDNICRRTVALQKGNHPFATYLPDEDGLDLRQWQTGGGGGGERKNLDVSVAVCIHGNQI